MARRKASTEQTAFDFDAPVVDLVALGLSKAPAVPEPISDALDASLAEQAVLSDEVADATTEISTEAEVSVQAPAGAFETRGEGGMAYRFFEVDLQAVAPEIAMAIQDHLGAWDDAKAAVRSFVEQHGLIDGYGSLIDLQGFVADEVKAGWREKETCAGRPVLVPDRNTPAGKAIATEIAALPVPPPMDEFTAALHKHIKMPRRNGFVAGLRRATTPERSATKVWMSLPSLPDGWMPPAGLRETAVADFVAAA